MGRVYAAFIRFVLPARFSVFEIAAVLGVVVLGLSWWQLLAAGVAAGAVHGYLCGLHSDILDDEEPFDDSDVLIEFDAADNTYTATRLSDGVVIARGPDAESLATDMIRKLKR